MSEQQHDETLPGYRSVAFSLARVVVRQMARWRILVVALCALLAGLVALYMTSDLFRVPQDVRQARKAFDHARQGFSKDPLRWQIEWSRTERGIYGALTGGREHEISSILRQLDSRAFVALLVNRVGFEPERLLSLCCMPKVSGSSYVVVFSKPEPGICPIHIMLSLEAEVRISPEIVSITLKRLRRGSRELSPGVAWAYFGSELSTLQRLPVRISATS